MNDFLTSLSYIDGDPEILPYSVITDQDPGRPNYACGQIKINSTFGQKIFDISKDKRYKNYLEIGTWCGLGTTKCILDGLILRNNNQRDGSKLVSIESNEKFYRITNQYWTKFFTIHKLDSSMFSLRFGSLVSYDELDSKYITDSGHTKETYDYNQDIKSGPIVNVDETVDVLCLDGGHFSTSIEWDMYKDQISVIILDDIKTSKTRNIVAEIQNSNIWSISYISDFRNGELIAQKRDL
jgi:hypothetical protein